MILRRKNLNILILLCSTLFISWGNVGHRIINENAARSFPQEIDFLLYWANGLAEHGSDADYRKGSDASEENKHYIDIDNFPEFNSAGKIAQDFDSLAAIHGYDFLMQQGILPWAIVETADSLTAAFSRHQWDKALLLAADLGHYIGDAHMPLHITRNYNGQFSSQNGVHSRFESKMIEKYDNDIFFESDSAAFIPNISGYVFNMIYDNYVYVDSVLLADRIATALAGNTWDNNYYAKCWQLSKSFTIQLFESASNRLASLIYTCWINAGSPNPTTNAFTLNEPVKDFVLNQNYPNPFNSLTNICFELELVSDISIALYNSTGQMIEEIFKGVREPGRHVISWNSVNASTGVYIIRMEAGNYVGTRKCMIIK